MNGNARWLLALGALGGLGVLIWRLMPKSYGLSSLADKHLIDQSTRFYVKKYGITPEDAQRLVTSKRRAQIEREIEDWRGQYGWPESSSPLVRGYARDKIHALAGPSMLRLIASESRSPEEYARRAEAWASGEAKPPSVATIAKAYRKGSPTQVTRLVRAAREKRLSATQARWRGYINRPEEAEDLVD